MFLSGICSSRCLRSFILPCKALGGDGGGGEGCMSRGDTDGFAGGCRSGASDRCPGKGGGGWKRDRQTRGRGLKGVGGDQGWEPGPADSEAAFGKRIAESFHPPAH